MKKYEINLANSNLAPTQFNSNEGVDLIIFSVILLPLRPASLTHKNRKIIRRKIICGMRPVRTQRREYPVCVISVAVLVAVV